VTRSVGCNRLGSFQFASTNSQNDTFCPLVFDYVFIGDPTTKEMTSTVLDKWYYENDTTFVCVLKDGVTFSTGDKATSEDVLYSVLNLYERNSPFLNLFGTLNPSKCMTRDDKTAVFVFDSPWGPGLSLMDIFLYNKAWCQKVGWDSPEWYSNPVGSGPYKVAEYVSDDHATFELRDDCWDKQDYTVDTWIVRAYPDLGTMFIDLQVGKIDLACGLSMDDYGKYKDSPPEGLTIKQVSQHDIEYLTMTIMANPKFEDINIRKAIAFGVDWDAIGQMGHGDLWKKPTSMVSADSPYHIDIGSYPFDTEQAKKILADAGYKPGDLEFVFTTFESEANKNMTEGLQFYLQQIGIKLDISFVDLATYLAKSMEPESFSDFGWSSNPLGSITGDPQKSWVMLSPVPYLPNAGIKNQEFLDLVKKALNTIKPEERKAAYAAAQQSLFNNFDTMPITDVQSAIAYKTGAFNETLLDESIIRPDAINLRHLSIAK
jgi:ABC-type transport system substrate-binding protein